MEDFGSVFTYWFSWSLKAFPLSQNDHGSDDGDNGDGSEHLCISYVLGSTLSTVHILTYLIITAALWRLLFPVYR